MTDTSERSALWKARAAAELSREHVSRLLDPPISAKTLERWEKGHNPPSKRRLRQLALIYRVRASDLNGDRPA